MKSLLYSLFLLLFSMGINACDKTPPADTPQPPQPEQGLPKFYVIGSRFDKVTSPQGGVVLAGGGSDVDKAMQWFLRRADGGDVVVLRASGDSGYNGYLYNKVGVDVNSVTSIVFTDRSQADKDSVYNTLMRAEAVFLAGGDQSKYVSYWDDTKVSKAFSQLIERGVPFGGTSAGMAVLGEVVYSARYESVTSREALRNPYDANVSLVRDLIVHPLTRNIVTDTHFSQRERMGRLLTFMARAKTDWAMDIHAIAADERSAVAIAPDGMAQVFGKRAFFVGDVAGAPEVCEKHTALTWLYDGEALTSYPMTPADGAFDTKRWQPVGSVAPEYLSVDNGTIVP